MKKQLRLTTKLWQISLIRNKNLIEIFSMYLAFHLFDAATNMIFMVSKVVLESSTLLWLRMSTRYQKMRNSWVQTNWRKQRRSKLKRMPKRTAEIRREVIKETRRKRRRLRLNLPRRSPRVNQNWCWQTRTKVRRRISVNLWFPVIGLVSTLNTRSRCRRAKSLMCHREIWTAISIV